MKFTWIFLSFTWIFASCLPMESTSTTQNTAQAPVVTNTLPPQQQIDPAQELDPSKIEKIVIFTPSNQKLQLSVGSTIQESFNRFFGGITRRIQNFKERFRASPEKRPVGKSEVPPVKKGVGGVEEGRPISEPKPSKIPPDMQGIAHNPPESMVANVQPMKEEIDAGHMFYPRPPEDPKFYIALSRYGDKWQTIPIISGVDISSASRLHPATQGKGYIWTGTEADISKVFAEQKTLSPNKGTDPNITSDGDGLTFYRVDANTIVVIRNSPSKK